MIETPAVEEPGPDVDGAYRPGSEEVCRRFQAEKGLKVDGKVGPNTWTATWTAAVA
jgi:peptidoglycan hydrolase-like protein with peptidoglycan-binding domain